MNDERKLQMLTDKFSTICYHGIYLWKYIEEDMLKGIFNDMLNNDKNLDMILPDDSVQLATQEQREEAQNVINNMEQKDILFFLAPVRRLYNGFYEHTIMDSYIDVIDENKYAVLEYEYNKSDNRIPTRNRSVFNPWAVTTIYGEQTADRSDILKFLYENYIAILQECFEKEISSEVIMKVVLRISLMVKQREAFLQYFKQIMKKVQPKVICYSYGPDYFVCFMREAAKELNIPTVEVAHGECILMMRYDDTIAYADYLVVHSDILCNIMRKNGLKHIYSLGKPGKYETVKKIQRTSTDPIIITVISSLEKELLLNAVELAKRLDARKYLVIFKTHNHEKWTDEEKTEIMNELDNWQFFDSKVDVRDLFELSDIVIGMRSSGILEALPYPDIKIIVMEDLYKQPLCWFGYDFFDILAEQSELTMFRTVDDLYNEVESYQRGHLYRGEVNSFWPADAKDRFQRFMNIFLDGKRPDEKQLEA